MNLWHSFILCIFLESPGYLAQKHVDLLSSAIITESQCVDTKFNSTTAKCFDTKDDKIDLDMIWPSKVTHKGSCYDKDGVRYAYGSSVPSCCGCITYYCYYSRNTKGYYNYWSLRSISSYCCQDSKGVIYPTDEVMSTVRLDDECATEKTTICKYNREWNKVMGVISEVYTARNCCLDSDGHHPVNTIKLDPSSCSERTCRPGNPTSLWSTCPVIPGEINCCLFNNTLIANGDMVETPSGVNVTCCDGEMVVKYNVTTPKNCSEKDAIHSSIGFAIDNTGSVSTSSVGVMALSNGLIDNILSLEYIIPKWVLVTFNDNPYYPSTEMYYTTRTTYYPPTETYYTTTAPYYPTTATYYPSTASYYPTTVTYYPPKERDITLNTDLRIVTDDVDLFRTSLNDITFSGGGDGPERATQGLWVTLTNLPKHGIALLFTDHQSKDLDMEPALTELRDKKNIKIFVVLTPKYSGSVGDASYEVYSRLSEGRIYNMADFNATQFLNEVVQVVGETCEDSLSP